MPIDTGGMINQMTVREFAAIEVLKGLISSESHGAGKMKEKNGGTEEENSVKYAYQFADLIIAHATN